MRISDWSSDGGSSDLLDLVVQDQRVDLVLARERGGVDGVEPGEDRLVEIDSRFAALGTEVVDPVVMAVVADLGRVDRVEPQPAVEPFLRQRGEGGVGFGSGRGGRVLRRSVGGGRGWRLWLAGGEGEGEQGDGGQGLARSEEHTSEVQSLMRTSYDVL